MSINAGGQMRPRGGEVVAEKEIVAEEGEEVVAEIAEADPLAKRVYDSYMAYLEDVRRYHSISEQAYMNLRESAD